MESPHVGTLREKPLHASLKQWCSEPGDRFEVPVDGYVIDVVRAGLLIEVQTSGFSGMKRKLTALLDAGHRVRIVHPVAETKWIVRLGDGGEVLSRRKSPKHGSLLSIFSELVSFPGLIDHEGLEVDVLLTHEDEIRTHQPGKAWRRKGWVVEERHLIEVVGSRRLASTPDLVGLLPGALPDRFTTADLAQAADCPRRIAQQVAYTLKHAGGITQVGKRGNSIEYALSG